MSDDVMMKLGTFDFSVDRAAYDRFVRQTEYRWPSLDVIGAREVLQYTGPGSDSITLAGKVFPMNGADGDLLSVAVGIRQVDQLRALAAQGQPLQLVSGIGDQLGKWVIERVEENVETFYAGGIPRRQDFAVSLRKFADPPQSVPLRKNGYR